jgi:type VI protein secretion system component VasF
MLSPELATELRSARPTASPELRERVRAVAAREEPRRTPRLTLPPLRSLAVVAVPAALALAIGGADVHGHGHSGRSGREVAGAKKVL